MCSAMSITRTWFLFALPSWGPSRIASRFPRVPHQQRPDEIIPHPFLTPKVQVSCCDLALEIRPRESTPPGERPTELSVHCHHSIMTRIAAETTPEVTAPAMAP